MGATSAGEWESLVALIVAPALEEAAVELNDRPGLVTEVSNHPFEEACVLWIGRRDPASPFLMTHGAFAIHDEPVLPMIRVEEADPRVQGGRPVVSVHLRRSELSIASVKRLALAFANRWPAIELAMSEGNAEPGLAASSAMAPAALNKPAAPIGLGGRDR
jgi:hypothetical protein